MENMLAARPLLAIALDLDDTLWPVKPTLIRAEQTLARWLAERAPRTAALLTPEIRLAIRDQLLAEHPLRAHDMSFVRRESLRRALHAAGEDPALAEPAFEAFLSARQKVTLYDDVEPVLERWSQRYPLIVVSNGNADVDRVGIGRFFAARVHAHELGFAKPDPRIFLEACARVGVEPAAVLHVGDDLDLDVRGARQAGLGAAWIRRPDLAGPAAVDVGEPGEWRAFDSLDSLDAALGGSP
ncbi:MAG: HAD family hydrolase [Gammaproteobacteria bacterium]